MKDYSRDMDFIGTIEQLAVFGDVELTDTCTCCKQYPMVIFTRQEFVGFRIDAYCVKCDEMDKWPLLQFGPEDYDDDACYGCEDCGGCVPHGGCECERCGECFETRDDCDCEEGFLEEEEYE